jgi:pimeloyl-ACP methyl ester carboxylesterase
LPGQASARKDGRVEQPETRFAWNGESALAYQILGEGEPDLLYLSGWISNVELNWDHPVMTRFLRRLANGRRLLVMDPRGTGCSERGTPRDVPQLETMMDDLIAVMDAAGSERIVLLATNEMAFVACMFAATYPERTVGLILYEASATFVRSDETWWEWTDERWEEEERRFRSWLGDPEGYTAAFRDSAPSHADDPSLFDWWYRYNLLSQGAGAGIAAGSRYRYTDIRGILPSIHVPVLVLARPEHPEASWAPAAEHLARSIAGARLIELPGRDGWLWAGDQAPVHAAVDAFLDDIGRERSELEQVLATVLFTDIVGSTERLAEVGDRAWRTSSNAITRTSAPSSSATAAPRSTPPGTGSSRRTTARRRRSAAPARSWSRSGHWGSRSEPASTPANARRSTARSAASR